MDSIDHLEERLTAAEYRESAPWTWRLDAASRIAASIDADRDGVRGVYLIGSTKNATAGPSSDIDLIIHVTGSDAQQRALEVWLDQCSRLFDEINFQHTGFRSGGLLDVHFVTDEDIERQTSFACKIGAINDPARRLPMSYEE